MTDKTRIISANDMHVIMTQCLRAAEEIQIAMCLFSDDHIAQRNLNTALSHVLTGAEQCNHLHRSEKFRIAEPAQGDDHSEGTRDNG